MQIEQSLGVCKKKLLEPNGPTGNWHITTVMRSLTTEISVGITVELLQHLALLVRYYRLLKDYFLLISMFSNVVYT